jgi:hypothetical protein
MVRLADALETPPQAPPKQEQVSAALGLLGYTTILLAVRVLASGECFFLGRG